MPITKRASKKLRHDRRRARATAKIHALLSRILKTTKKNPTKKTLSLAFKTLDKAAKRRIIHPNKAARLKARLAH